MQVLRYIHTQSRSEGIDAALKCTSVGNDTESDTLLLCDRKGAGQ